MNSHFKGSKCTSMTSGAVWCFNGFHDYNITVISILFIYGCQYQNIPVTVIVTFGLVGSKHWRVSDPIYNLFLYIQAPEYRPVYNPISTPLGDNRDTVPHACRTRIFSLKCKIYLNILIYFG